MVVGSGPPTTPTSPPSAGAPTPRALAAQRDLVGDQLLGSRLVDRGERGRLGQGVVETLVHARRPGPAARRACGPVRPAAPRRRWRHFRASSARRVGGGLSTGHLLLTHHQVVDDALAVLGHDLHDAVGEAGVVGVGERQHPQGVRGGWTHVGLDRVVGDDLAGVLEVDLGLLDLGVGGARRCIGVAGGLAGAVHLVALGVVALLAGRRARPAARPGWRSARRCRRSPRSALRRAAVRSASPIRQTTASSSGDAGEGGRARRGHRWINVPSAVAR